MEDHKYSSLRRSEVVLRVLVTILLVVTVLLIGFDHDTEELFYQISKRATYKYLNALVVVVWVHSGTAIYNLLQLGRCIFFSRSVSNPLQTINGTSKPSSFQLTIAFICFLMDQVISYVVFSVNTAGLEASAMGIMGSKKFQWMKLCNKFNKFCIQGAAGLLCGYGACILMVAISSISAYNLFRHFSPNKLLVLKIK